MDSMQRLIQLDAVTRLVDRDPQLFSEEIDLRQPIMQRLGWTDLSEKAANRTPLVTNLASAVWEEGATDIVLLGMGGSSLAALVLERVIGRAPDAPRLHVLDTTSPSTIAGLLGSLDRKGAYFLLSSKSGSTVEPLSLYAIFRAWMEEELERAVAGRHFVVITDPGSPLEKLKTKDFMRLALAAPPTVGGRFSALSVFGLAPAALIGIDLPRLTAMAHAMETECHGNADENPAALLAAFIGDAYAAGRDKLTLVTSEAYSAFGLWVEQLVAESTGKRGVGVVPVLDYEPTTPTGYGDDRAVVVLRRSNDAGLASFAANARAEGHPVLEHLLDDPYCIGAEFVRWEHAIALVGVLLGINPFDEPNVAEAKATTDAVLRGVADVPPAIADIDGIWPTYAGALAGAAAPSDLVTALAPLGAALRPHDYLAVLAYLPEASPGLAALRHALESVSSAMGVAACLEIGPRYLHSTGQLHKGGPDTGVFLVITTRDRTNVAIPGQKFSLAQLYRAQAEGDLTTLATHGRRVMRLDLPGEDAEMTKRVAEALVASVR